MVFLILTGILVVSIYFFNQYVFSYWSRRGFKQLDTTFIVGNGGPLFTNKMSIGSFMESIYNEHKEHKIIGLYLLHQAVLVVNDAKLVQDIMIRDFQSFHDRPMPVDEVKDPLSAHLFNISGQKWRDMRVKLSPTFTSGKLKGMFSIIGQCGKTLEDYLVQNVKEGTDVFEFRDLMARYNTNIISSVAFGIDNDCINDPDHIFRKMGASFFEPTFKNGIKAIMTFLMPSLLHKLGFKQVEDDLEEFIVSIVKQTVEHREKNNFTRNDFMQLLLQLKNQGFVSVDKGEKVADDPLGKGNMNKLTIEEVAAQVFVFFIAGFETSSSTMSFCLFELARHPELQRKVQEEADKVFKSAGPEGVTYEMMNDLKYTECCVDETLRKYPIVPLLFRKATKDYKVADSDLVIPQGTSVFIPTLGFQRDPDIYDTPLEFKPERFMDSPTGNGKVKGLFYTPFGDGPRNCIGMRMGKLTTKIGLALILHKFNIELVDKDMIDKELEFHPNQFVLTPLKPFNIKITHR